MSVAGFRGFIHWPLLRGSGPSFAVPFKPWPEREDCCDDIARGRRVPAGHFTLGAISLAWRLVVRPSFALATASSFPIASLRTAGSLLSSAFLRGWRAQSPRDFDPLEDRGDVGPPRAVAEVSQDSCFERPWALGDTPAKVIF